MASPSFKPKALPRHWALFVTANIPAKTFNALFEHEDPVQNKYENIWVLVDDPANHGFKHKLSLAPEGDTIRTGFHNPTITELGTFCARTFQFLWAYDDSTRVSDELFAAMDERSIEDQTVRLVQWDQEPQKDDDGRRIRDDLFVNRWATARATFKDASSWIRVVAHKHLIDAKELRDPPLGDNDVLEDLGCV